MNEQPVIVIVGIRRVSVSEIPLAKFEYIGEI